MKVKDGPGNQFKEEISPCNGKVNVFQWSEGAPRFPNFGTIPKSCASEHCAATHQMTAVIVKRAVHGRSERRL